MTNMDFQKQAEKGTKSHGGKFCLGAGMALSCAFSKQAIRERQIDRDIQRQRDTVLRKHSEEISL